MRNDFKFAVLLSTAVLLMTGCNNVPLLNDVKETLARDLPLGTTTTEVVSYLDAKHITHFDCEIQEGNCIGARLSGGPQKLSIVRTDYMLNFAFDKNNRLSAIAVKPVYTGL